MNKTLRAAKFLVTGPLILGVLLVINLMTSPGHWWVQWAALGIGIAWVISFMVLSLFATVVGLITTNPAQPAVVAPLAGQFAEAAGWPLHAALMTSAVGFTVMVLPYQVPPVVVGIRAAGIPLRTVMRMAWPLLVISVVVLLPLDYLWWRLIGYFG